MLVNVTPEELVSSLAYYVEADLLAVLERLEIEGIVELKPEE